MGVFDGKQILNASVTSDKIAEDVFANMPIASSDEVLTNSSAGLKTNLSLVSDGSDMVLYGRDNIELGRVNIAIGNIQNAYYDSAKDEIVIVVVVQEGTDEIRIPADDLIDIYTGKEYIDVDSDNVISLNYELVKDQLIIDGVNTGINISDYYTSAQINSLVSKYLPLEGGTVTGDLTVEGQLFYEGKRIHVEENIDEILTPGTYYIAASPTTIGGTLPDGFDPIQSSVLLVYSVGTTNGYKQVLYNNTRHFSRSIGATGTPAAWYEYARTNDLASYLPLSGGEMKGNLQLNSNQLQLGTSSAQRLALDTQANAVELRSEISGGLNLTSTNGNLALSTPNSIATYNGKEIATKDDIPIENRFLEFTNVDTSQGSSGEIIEIAGSNVPNNTATINLGWQFTKSILGNAKEIRFVGSSVEVGAGSGTSNFFGKNIIIDNYGITSDTIKVLSNEIQIGSIGSSTTNSTEIVKIDGDSIDIAAHGELSLKAITGNASIQAEGEVYLYSLNENVTIVSNNNDVIINGYEIGIGNGGNQDGTIIIGKLTRDVDIRSSNTIWDLNGDFTMNTVDGNISLFAGTSATDNRIYIGGNTGNIRTHEIDICANNSVAIYSKDTIYIGYVADSISTMNEIHINSGKTYLEIQGEEVRLANNVNYTGDLDIGHTGRSVFIEGEYLTIQSANSIRIGTDNSLGTEVSIGSPAKPVGINGSTISLGSTSSNVVINGSQVNIGGNTIVKMNSSALDFQSTGGISIGTSSTDHSPIDIGNGNRQIIVSADSLGLQGEVVHIGTLLRGTSNINIGHTNRGVNINSSSATYNGKEIATIDKLLEPVYINITDIANINLASMDLQASTDPTIQQQKINIVRNFLGLPSTATKEDIRTRLYKEIFTPCCREGRPLYFVYADRGSITNNDNSTRLYQIPVAIDGLPGATGFGGSWIFHYAALNGVNITVQISLSSVFSEDDWITFVVVDQITMADVRNLKTSLATDYIVNGVNTKIINVTSQYDDIIFDTPAQAEYDGEYLLLGTHTNRTGSLSMGHTMRNTNLSGSKVAITADDSLNISASNNYINLTAGDRVTLENGAGGGLAVDGPYIKIGHQSATPLSMSAGYIFNADNLSIQSDALNIGTNKDYVGNISLGHSARSIVINGNSAVFTVGNNSTFLSASMGDGVIMSGCGSNMNIINQGEGNICIGEGANATLIYGSRFDTNVTDSINLKAAIGASLSMANNNIPDARIVWGNLNGTTLGNYYTTTRVNSKNGSLSFNDTGLLIESETINIGTSGTNSLNIGNNNSGSTVAIKSSSSVSIGSSSGSVTMSAATGINLNTSSSNTVAINTQSGNVTIGNANSAVNISGATSISSSNLKTPNLPLAQSPGSIWQIAIREGASSEWKYCSLATLKAALNAL